MSEVDSVAAIELDIVSNDRLEVGWDNGQDTPLTSPQKTVSTPLKRSTLFLTEDGSSSPYNGVESASRIDYKKRHRFEIVLSPLRNRDDYIEFPEEYVVTKVIRELRPWNDEPRYEVRLEDGKKLNV